MELDNELLPTNLDIQTLTLGFSISPEVKRVNSPFVGAGEGGRFHTASCFHSSPK